MSTAKNGMTDEPRDPQIARAYRDAVDDDPAAAHPPAALDDAIRAAARRAANTGPETRAAAGRRSDAIKRGFRRTWQTPLAAAATVALAVGVAIKVYDSGEADLGLERSQSVPSSPTAAPAPASPPAVAVVKADSAAVDRAPLRDAAPPVEAESKVVGESARQPPAAIARLEPISKPTAEATPPGASLSEERVARRKGAVTAETERPKAREESDVPPSMASALPAPAAAPPLAQAGADASLRRDAPAVLQRSADGHLALQAEPAPSAGRSWNQPPARRAEMEDRMAPGSTVSALLAQLATRPVDAWIEEMRALKRAGRIADANTLRTEFQKRFPDVRLPDDLR
ncbi:MAG: hypothetical protein ACKVQU_33205 [Burkholderiales bacterium]